MIMNGQTVQNVAAWDALGVECPSYNVAETAAKTLRAPIWLHFGAGNIFRGYIAALQQRLLNAGLSEKGIIAIESFDFDIIERLYKPYDNLTMNVTLHADASIRNEIIGSIADGISLDSIAGREHLHAWMKDPGLQMVSFTITEKGYALHGADGVQFPGVIQDMQDGPENAHHVMGGVAAALYTRFLAGATPIAMISMDNCSHNGDRLKESVLAFAENWLQNGYVEEAFLAYLKDSSKVSFPWSMIDKITPRPSAEVAAMLAEKGIEEMQPVATSRNTYIAPFVNAERPEYLVIEDDFPNGRPPLEKAGVYMTTRDMVNKTERMKVTTCLNPLHTAMSVYGCLLGYTRISAEMKDGDIVALIRRLGYTEGLPVVTDPGIISPRAFIDEVIQERLPNPFMPDTPQRIATDTSQKVGIRFGETIKSYIEKGMALDTLIAIPLAIAGWLRYLLGVDDNGETMEVSPDPMKESLQDMLAGVEWNVPQSYSGQLLPILANTTIFGTDLTQTCLGHTIETMFIETLGGIGAVRATLQRHITSGKTYGTLHV